jgi:hypothetical protein
MYVRGVQLSRSQLGCIRSNASSYSQARNWFPLGIANGALNAFPFQCVSTTAGFHLHIFSFWNKGFLPEGASPVTLSLGADIPKQDKEVEP